jgi:transcriptional regulator with XRE-family HTH domain
MSTLITVNTTRELGKVIRAARKFQHLRQDEVGRFSHTFIGELEAGKPTAQIGKVLEALRELGLKVQIELPPGVDPQAFETARVART